MRLLLGSDFHCDERLQAEAIAHLSAVDRFIYCGDFCTWAGRLPEAAQQGFHPKGAAELEQLRQFIRRLDVVGTPWMFVPGNHEPPAETMAKVFEEEGIKNGHLVVEPERMRWGHLEVLVVPWTPPCGWCWTLSRDRLKSLLETYRHEPIDVLISHAPPEGNAG